MSQAASQSLADLQVAEFLAKHEGAEASSIQAGCWVIHVPAVPLDTTIWCKSHTRVVFVVPGAFPVQPPDCFWADADLLFRDGREPTNSNTQNPCPNYGTMRWFSYHTQAWDVRCTVETYFHLIQGRLIDPR